MKLVVQRVVNADVSVDGKVVGEIHGGVFVLIGVKKGDTQENADYLAEKLFKLRIMMDGDGKMNRSLKDAGAHILAVSQFTLYANTKGGNRPSFIDAEEPAKARKIYEYFVGRLRVAGLKVETGSFGKYMNINAELDGPVTVILTS